MEIIIFLIPIIVAIFLFVKFREETTILEYCLLVIPSVLIFILMRLSIVTYETSDTEYIGQHITKIVHYDEWNEWIHRTCYRTATTGKTTVSIPYDCSYCEHYPESWVMITNTGNEIYIGKNEFTRLKNKWNTPMVFIEMNRHFYTIDGDAQSYSWNNVSVDARTLTVSHSYENKIQASKSIFNFETLKESEVKKLGLFEYPQIDDDGDQNPILGYKARPVSIARMKYINGFYGKPLQFRTYLLVFKNKPYSISEKQRSYWCGGNKNELVVCVGIDSTTQKVQWANAFSWMDNPILDIKAETYFADNNGKTIDIEDYSNWLETNARHYWKRKDFKSFEYISIELTMGQYIAILIITLIYNILISVYIVKNDYRN